MSEENALAKLKKVDSQVCEYVIGALNPVIDHLQAVVDSFTDVPKLVLLDDRGSN